MPLSANYANSNSAWAGALAVGHYQLQSSYCSQTSSFSAEVSNVTTPTSSSLRIALIVALSVSCVLPACPLLAQPGLTDRDSAVISLNNDGVKALNANNYQLGISLFEAALKKDPDYDIAHDNLAIAHNMYGVSLRPNPRAALVEFHKAIWLNPMHPTAVQNAEETIRALGKNPNSPDDRLELGDEAIKSGDLQGAIIEYRAANQHRPDPKVYIKIGDVFHSRGEDDKALMEYQEAARTGDTAETEVKLGRIHESKEDISSAIAAYGKAIAFNLNNPDAISGLISAWTKAVLKMPTAAENHIGLGQAYQYRGDFGQAEAEYRTALKFAPQHCNPVAERLLAALPAAKQRAEETKHINAGGDLLSRGLFYAAIKEYQQALDLDPNNAAIFVNIGTAYQDAKNSDLALKAYREAEVLDLGNQDVQQGIKTAIAQRKNQMVSDDRRAGTDLFNEGDYQAAAEKYMEVSKIVPNDAATHFSLGAAYQAMKKIDDAISEYRTATKIDQNNQQYQKALADALQLKIDSPAKP